MREIVRLLLPSGKTSSIGLVSAFLFSIILLAFSGSGVSAQNSDYGISSFASDITIGQDTSVLVEETIDVEFSAQKHGIFRYIPVIYRTDRGILNARFELVSIKDRDNNSYKYEKSKSGDNIVLKIGDPDKTIAGDHTYIISYRMFNVLQISEDAREAELYLNVVGSGWDTDIRKASVTLSASGTIIETLCFAGAFGTQESDCSISAEGATARGETLDVTSPGEDFTIVARVENTTGFTGPGTDRRIMWFIRDQGIIFVLPLPLLVMLYIWYRRGRDSQWAGENVYYRPEKYEVRNKPLFSRAHLPLVYHPIDGLSPAELGVLLDERVDIHDVVAEIVELGRLGFLKIERTVTKKLLGKDKQDYSFTKLDKDVRELEDYQKFILDKLFDKSTEVTLSELKHNFYVHLEEFKKKLYADVAANGLFEGDPSKTRTKWIIIAVAMVVGAAVLGIFTSDPVTKPAVFFAAYFAVLPVVGIISLVLAYKMPRRTPQGYALYRQAKGLQFYLSKGKWREEVNEKHLFFTEMLPLAIALGVVNQLARDMDKLGIAPPQYVHGMTSATFSRDFSNFQRSAATGLATGAKGSSWSGGSGFSGGGFSGGGAGGGGGGSW